MVACLATTSAACSPARSGSGAVCVRPLEFGALGHGSPMDFLTVFFGPQRSRILNTVADDHWNARVRSGTGLWGRCEMPRTRSEGMFRRFTSSPSGPQPDIQIRSPV